ncbi:unnamed protein product [Toxocara canis]|uniref:Reverse transcriptase domain-containing protein n=1 Tax=Toxocara canis TaxID=6265 RepID=A0A183TWU5_TOXCA|nr:unnamed protein product [Toxocara canis]
MAEEMRTIKPTVGNLEVATSNAEASFGELNPPELQRKVADSLFGYNQFTDFIPAADVKHPENDYELSENAVGHSSSPKEYEDQLAADLFKEALKTIGNPSGTPSHKFIFI